MHKFTLDIFHKKYNFNIIRTHKYNFTSFYTRKKAAKTAASYTFYLYFKKYTFPLS